MFLTKPNIDITTFEEEFLAHIVLADGKTIGEHISPQIPELCSVGGLPKLLPAIGETGQKVVRGKFN